MNLKRYPNSFTLIEMLVGMAVLSLLVLLLFSILNHTTGLWQQQSSKEGDFREARAFMHSLSRDLTVALASTNTAWFYSSTNQLAFLTTRPDSVQVANLNNGDICAVGYSWEWGTNDPSATQPNMSLYRYISFSGPTYTNIIMGNPTPVPVSSIFSNPDGVNTVKELIARNVCQFSVTSYTTNSAGEPEVVASPTVLPSLLDITITTVNDRVAALLKTQQQWLDTNSIQIQQNEESFTLRVRPQGP